MCAYLIALIAGVSLLTAIDSAQTPRLNSVIELLEQKTSVFGVYMPGPPRGKRATAPTASTAPVSVKTTAEYAKDALAYEVGDFLFSGGMEGGLERGLAPFTDFVNALATSPVRTRHPLVVKTPKIGADPLKAAENISRQLDLGVTTIVLVGVESADEMKHGLAAMRFKSRGGTRPDEVGTAPGYLGVTERQYRDRADLWPLNPKGELLNWAIVESKEGLARVREIAAVKGVGVLFPGAGTLRGVFSSTNSDGQRVFDADGWEAAIQQVLAACKEFNVPCGYPATEYDIEMRMKQGFSVFIINWGEAGFRAVEKGRKLAGRRPL
jgi:4-hydroxy-2-oxoheptanedioate aldolase